MLNFGDLLFQVGLADSNERDYLQNQTLLIQKAIQEQRWMDAFTIEDALMDGDIYKYPTYFYNITGSRYYYNYLQSAEPAGFGNYLEYVNQCFVRKAIHVGNQIFDGGVKVEKYLLNDIFQTAKQYLVPLLENYRVLLYNGQLDLICGLPLTENYLDKLVWNGAQAFRNSEKTVWKVEEQDVEPAGFVRQSGDFYQVAVRKGNLTFKFD
jgi:vitellogenic carboxypeptidase-like protein